MITKVSHQISDRGPADFILALWVSRDLHAPIPAPRTPESSSRANRPTSRTTRPATRRAPRRAPRAAQPTAHAPEDVVTTQFPELMGLRTGPVRTHRRKVPLNRLTAVRA
ncbi:hypothetical protein AQI95_10025 [Streptomyces yokosukanensis]|uniref:Uncharacterized protein n=1 Tax=Streptomyces yokosukanensis TaxID=67386 RepID=A0A101PA69_9ACTN|nr:hypothetical protein [Streptomyces yokosukanensis]KUN07726.1 hypothetical protein AQI95_10025 [Streptomyces yokosukanensis]